MTSGGYVTSTDVYQNVFLSFKTGFATTNSSNQRIGILLRDGPGPSYAFPMKYYFYMSNGNVYTFPGNLSPISPFNPVAVKTYNSNDTFSISLTNNLSNSSNLAFFVNGYSVYTSNANTSNSLYTIGFSNLSNTNTISNIVFTGSYGSFISSSCLTFPSHTNYVSSPTFLNVGLADYGNELSVVSISNYQSSLYFNGSVVAGTPLPGGGFSSMTIIGIGCNASAVRAGANVIGIGFNAAYSNASPNVVAIGWTAGFCNGATPFVSSSNQNSIAIGAAAGYVNQNSNSIAIGCNAGSNTQAAFAIAIGYNAAGGTLIGQSQSNSAIAIGCNAGTTSQGSNAIAIGTNAGNTTQCNFAIAIGSNAGNLSQSSNAIAIGPNAGASSQGCNAIAIGCNAGNNSQTSNSICIGTNTSVGANFGIAIGYNASVPISQNNSIVINASGVTTSAQTSNAFYVNPVRGVPLGNNVLSYNSATSEIFYTSTVTIRLLNATVGVQCNGTYLNSDSNLKENISSANLALCYETIKNLPLHRFNYISSLSNTKHDMSQIGFIAQEVYRIFPKSIYSTFSEAISTEVLNLNYDQIFMSHYGATQLLISTVESVTESTYSQESTLKSLQELQSQQESTVQGQNLEILTLVSSYQSLITQVSSFMN
jgi:hypothetical protein